jgi:DNA mismatch repair protein MutL
LLPPSPQLAPPAAAPRRSNGYFSSSRVVGQVFDTYIMLENRDVMTIIDQHAAHERLLFERLKAQYASARAQSQMLLEGVTVTLLADEMLLVGEAMPLLNKAGFSLDEFGHDAVILREAPLYLERQDIKGFFLDLLEIVRKDRMKGKTLANSDTINAEILYDIACKAAVKANKRMSAEETAALLRDMDSLPPPLTCPHGRPLTVSMNKKEFEKRFRRIV